MTDAEIGAKIGEIIAVAREAGMPDEAIIVKLTEVIQALSEGYLDFGAQPRVRLGETHTTEKAGIKPASPAYLNP